MTHLKLGLIAIFLATSGCYTTTVRNGNMPDNAPADGARAGRSDARAPLETKEKWHSGFVGGTAEASGPYDLKDICPNGWAEIRTETSFANGLLEIVTLSLYNPQTIDVKCAEPAPTAKAGKSDKG